MKLDEAIEYFEHRIMVNDWGKPSCEQHLSVIKQAAKDLQTIIGEFEYDNCIDDHWHTILKNVCSKYIGD